MTKDELIELINHTVYENEDGDITGEVMNLVLNAIVATIGVEANPDDEATGTLTKIKIGEEVFDVEGGGVELPDGALYGGIAWPNNPPTYGDDHRYFYLAYHQGNYPGFNIELDGNSLVLFHWLEQGQAWYFDYIAVTSVGLQETLQRYLESNELYMWLGFDIFHPYSSYVIGDFVTYEGGFFVFVANHPAGQWDEEDVAEASLVDYITNYVSKQLSGKQDVISDLAAIRSGAAAGATAYQKPSGGIPKTDLASGVQTSLGKADTAIQDVSNKVDKVQAATAGNIAQFVSGGNLENSGINSDDVFELLELSVSIVDASTPPAIIEPNKVYKYGTLSGNTTFPALETPAYPDAANVYCWTFTTPATAPTITWPSAITSWAGGSAPTINASKSYEVSVMDGFATIIEN